MGFCKNPFVEFQEDLTGFDRFTKSIFERVTSINIGSVSLGISIVVRVVRVVGVEISAARRWPANA